MSRIPTQDRKRRQKELIKFTKDRTKWRETIASTSKTDNLIDAQKKKNNKQLSSSDDDSDADSTISSETVLDAKTRKPFKANPGAKTSNSTQYSVKNAY